MVLTVGLNSIREILAKCSFAVDEDLLQDLAAYKSYRNKNVSVAARSIIQLYREENPHLLKKKDRGKPNEARKELVVKSYGHTHAADYIAGAECLSAEANGEEGEGSDGSDDGDSDSDGWIDVDQGADALVDVGADEAEDCEDEDDVSKEEKAQAVSTTRILSQEEHRKIHAHQIRKRILPFRKNDKNKKARTMEEEVAVSEPQSAHEAGRLANLKDIEKLHKKPKQNKESRLASVLEGREGREAFNKPKQKGPHVGRTQKQMNKNKNFMMVRQKNKKKIKKSFQEKQRSLRDYLVKQKKMK